MQSFTPQEIYLDVNAINDPVTQRILTQFPNLPVHKITDRSEIKQPADHNRAKKQLFLTRHQGKALKSCQGMGDYVCCQYFTIALVSDCHLECTYCILQDYLKNNPVITIYTNPDTIFEEIIERASKNPDRSFRVGTGELSDSLALDHITKFSHDIHALAKKCPNGVFEFKTKTSNIDELLKLPALENIVVSWSLNPQSYIRLEEHKCDSLDVRLDAARRCAEHGYKVGLHLDPLLALDNWESEYEGVIQQIAKTVPLPAIAWVSIGSLRFTPELKKITQERFPKSKIMSGELYPSQDGKMRYFRPIREQMYQKISEFIKTYLKTAPQYLCMETSTVWESVYGEVPKRSRDLENDLLERFEGFAV